LTATELPVDTFHRVIPPAHRVDQGVGRHVDKRRQLGDGTSGPNPRNFGRPGWLVEESELLQVVLIEDQPALLIRELESGSVEVVQCAAGGVVGSGLVRKSSAVVVDENLAKRWGSR